MEKEEERSAAEIISSLARHLNRLDGDEKGTRRRALEAIQGETLGKNLSKDVLQEVFACLLNSLLRCLSDPMERCREVAIETLGGFITGVSRAESSLPYIMPCLVQRLGGNEIVEPAEEVRLSMVKVLTLIVEVCKKHIAPYADDVINILQKTITDPFPDVKRESCKCTILFARCMPEHFHTQSECLVKPLMQTISHQHSRVRLAAIEATGAVVLYGSAKTMDDVLSHMAQRLFDNSPQVRKAVALVAAEWLLKLRDRYSYFHKLIPLLLSSYNDDLPEIRTLTQESWRQVGFQWKKENEEDIKEKIDYNFPPTQYPSGVDRPGLGCRELVVRNLSKLMPAMIHEARDWLVPTRVKTLQLLCVLLLHAEEHCTQHLSQLLPTLYHACTDSEKDVRTYGLESARLLGVFVSPEVFLKLLLAHVKDSSSHSYSPWAPLMVLVAMLKGSNRKVLGPHLSQIGQTLAHPDVCQESQQTVYVEQLLACVEVLLQVCEEDCSIISLPLLKVLVTVQCVSAEPQIQTEAEECVLSLCHALSLSSVQELYRQHMAQLLQWLTESPNSWPAYSVKKTQLEIIALQAGPVVGEFLPELMPLLQNYLLPSQDPEMRLHIFTMLSKLLLDASNTLNSQGVFCEYLQLFLQDLLLPNLVWRAGQVAAAVRTSALSCLLALLQGGAISKEQVLNMETEFSSHLISALEEDSQLSRLLACRSISSFITVTERRLNPDTLNKIYPELLKRIDDSSQDVRVEALKALIVWLSSLDKNYDTDTNRPNLEYLLQHLLLYLDDPDRQIQLMVLEVLKASSVADPALLKRKVEEAREKQCSYEYCDQLLQYIQSI